jgi:hypothetical protein
MQRKEAMTTRTYPCKLWKLRRHSPSLPLSFDMVEGETANFYVREGGSRFSKKDHYTTFFYDLKEALDYRARLCAAEAVNLEEAAERAKKDAVRALDEVKLTEAEYMKLLLERLT